MNGMKFKNVDVHSCLSGQPEALAMSPSTCVPQLAREVSVVRVVHGTGGINGMPTRNGGRVVPPNEEG